MHVGRWVLVGMVLGGLAASAHAEDVTIQGEVIDPGLYLREGRHGLEVEEQTFDAVDGGQSLALLQDDTGAVYFCLAAQPGDDPNEWLYEYVGRRVAVTGEVYERGGATGIVITNVQPLDPPPAADSGDTDAADAAL